MDSRSRRDLATASNGNSSPHVVGGEAVFSSAHPWALDLQVYDIYRYLPPSTQALELELVGLFVF